MYKNGTPPIMLMNKESENSNDYTEKKGRHDIKPSTHVKCKKSSPSDLNHFGLKKGFLTRDRTTERENKVENIKEEGQKISSIGIDVPKYELVERGKFELLNHFGSGFTKTTASTSRPEFLVYRIKLPKLNDSDDIELEIGEDKLCLNSKPSTTSKYELSLDLPYTVKFEDGTAKFHTDSKVLEIKLPVRKSPSSTSPLHTIPKPQDEQRQ
eukprot:9577839-Ditylum_brightwellii.AAC.1